MAKMFSKLFAKQLRRLSPSVCLPIRALWPIKSLIYFEAHLEGVENLRLYGAPRERLQVMGAFLLYLYFNLHNVYLSVANNKTTLDRVPHGDLIYFIFKRSDLRALFTAVTWVVVYFLYAFYWNSNVTVLSLVKNLLLRKEEHIQVVNRLVTRYAPIMPTFRHTSVLALTKRLVVIYGNSLQVFVFLIEIILLNFYLKLISEILLNWQSLLELPPFWLFLGSLFTLLNILHITFILLSFPHILILCVSLMAIAVTFLYIRIEQNLALLSCAQVRFTWRRVNRFLVNDITNFEFLFLVDGNNCQFFFVYNLINCPISAYFLQLCLQRQIRGLVTFYLGAFILQQFVCLLLLHIAYAFFTKKLYKSAHLLGHLLAVKQGKKGSMRFRYKVACAYCRLHTTQHYGMSYGPWTRSPITLESFAKYSLLWSEMLMYSYTLIMT